MIFAAILAGGTGTRMDIDAMPKQFLPLAGKPILIHTLEKFCLASRLDGIYVGVHPDWLSHTERLLAEYGLGDYAITLVPGGGTRNDTILNVVEAIERDHGDSADNIVVTHDSVRPFVKLATIEANIDAALATGACDTVIPATDTIVRASDDGTRVGRIPTRDRMYQGQTPQSFKAATFKRCYAALTAEQRAQMSDACRVLVEAGEPVALVPGDVTNIKLTTIMDYKVAQAMVEGGGLDQ
jgi:2-C-methyl-D-erythritol 4-phosphate cytidylyltransferase